MYLDKCKSFFEELRTAVPQFIDHTLSISYCAAPLETCPILSFEAHMSNYCFPVPSMSEHLVGVALTLQQNNCNSAKRELSHVGHIEHHPRSRDLGGHLTCFTWLPGQRTHLQLSALPPAEHSRIRSFLQDVFQELVFECRGGGTLRLT